MTHLRCDMHVYIYELAKAKHKHNFRMISKNLLRIPSHYFHQIWNLPPFVSGKIQINVLSENEHMTTGEPLFSKNKNQNNTVTKNCPPRYHQLWRLQVLSELLKHSKRVSYLIIVHCIKWWDHFDNCFTRKLCLHRTRSRYRYGLWIRRKPSIISLAFSTTYKQ